MRRVCSFILVLLKGKLGFFPQDFLFVCSLLQFVYDMTGIDLSNYQLHVLWASPDLWSLSLILESSQPLFHLNYFFFSIPSLFSLPDVTVMHMIHLLILSPREWLFSFFPILFTLSISAWKVSFDLSSKIAGFSSAISCLSAHFYRRSSFLLVFLIFSISVYSFDFPFLCLHHPPILAFCLLFSIRALSILIIVILSSLPDDSKICYGWFQWFLQSVLLSFLACLVIWCWKPDTL